MEPINSFESLEYWSRTHWDDLTNPYNDRVEDLIQLILELIREYLQYTVTDSDLEEKLLMEYLDKIYKGGGP